MWLVSSVLIGATALYRQDPVFILLQASTLTSAAIVLFLAHKYRGMVCAFHARQGRAESRTSYVRLRTAGVLPLARTRRSCAI